MNYQFINHNKHIVQISGPNKEMIRLAPGQQRTLSEYYLKYCPKFIKIVKKYDANEELRKQKQRLSPTRRNRRPSFNKTKRKQKRNKLPEVNPSIKTSDVGIGILSCNRLKCIKRLLESIKKYSNIENINVIVSDESTDINVKEYLRKIKWIKLLDHQERRGVVHNTNALLHALSPYKFKMMLNDDVEIKNNGWETFYFDAMIKTDYHHFCYREYNIYGASTKDEKDINKNGFNIKTIKSKPQGAILTFDDHAFKTVGYYDTKFPRYGMAHVDWSNRISASGIQPEGFHDVSGSNNYFMIHPEKTVEENKSKILQEAKAIYKDLSVRRNRIYIAPTEIYKSKFHIIINSYNRSEFIDLLLRDICEQKSIHDICVYIYDDASKEDYSKIINKYQDINITYKKFDNNHGKENYWKLVSNNFADAANSNAHYFVKLDDDVRLVDGFFDKCIKYWNNIADNKKICMNPLLDELRKGKVVWTGINPKKVKFGNYEYWNSGWVDMMFFCEKKFFAELNYVINPISKIRWKRYPNRSSGVGAQISQRLANKWSMYQVGESLLIHENHESKMNADIRKHQPIISISKKDPVIVTMASTASRMESLEHVVNSIYGQCDELHIYLNDYNSVPEFLNKPNIITYSSSEFGDIGDIGKFFPSVEEGYRFTIDDDIIYPHDYIKQMVHKIDEYDKKKCIGVHGAKINPSMNDYYKDRTCLHYRFAQKKDEPVHILGTGTLAFHSDTIKISRDDFEIPNMADIWFAIAAQKQKIGLISIARKLKWLRDAPQVNQGDSIYHKRSTADIQTNMIKSFGKWKIY